MLKRKWDGRLLLYLSIPTYVAAVSVNNSICLHYYHPALSFLPILFAEIWQDFGEDETMNETKTAPALALAMSVVVAAMAVFAVATTVSDPRQMIPFVSNVSNLPKNVVWMINAGYILVPAFVLTLVIFRFRGFQALQREGWAWFLLAAVGTSVAFSAFPHVQLAPHVRQTAGEWLCPMALSCVASFAFLAIAFAMPSGGLRSRACHVYVPTIIVLCFVFSPTWRKATVELLRPGRHLQRAVAKEIARLVPKNAVVIGERSTQVLMGHPLKTATTMPGCDPTEILENLLKKDPKTPLYALADSQNAYNLMHYREHAKEYALIPVKTFQMPSFANGNSAPVYLLQILPLFPAGPWPIPD